MKTIKQCICSSNINYQQCCGKYLDQGAYPQTAESLMRSRYTAYCNANRQYLEKTWHPDFCPVLNEDELKLTQWLRLEIINVKPGLKKSIVEFKAYYQDGQTEQCLHEVSQFKKIKNRWVYVKAENF